MGQSVIVAAVNPVAAGVETFSAVTKLHVTCDRRQRPIANNEGHVNEVTRCRLRLVLGKVIVRRHTVLVKCNQLPWRTQPSTVSGMENKYRPRCGDALRLVSKGCMYDSLLRPR